MALTLGVRIGDTLYFGDEPVKVMNLIGHELAILEARGVLVPIGNVKAAELLPGVFVSTGLPKQLRGTIGTIATLVIDAPRSVVILRGDLYGRPRPSKSARVHNTAGCGTAGT